MSTIAVVPGSFDPVTLGHIDVIRRATKVFDEVHVVVVHNPNKSAMLPAATRVDLLNRSLEEAGITGVVVAQWGVGLLVDYCTEVGAKVLVKGIRSEIDIAYETPMAIVNRNLGDIETMFMLPAPEHAHVSSSLVRQVASLAGDVTPYVPGPVAELLEQDPHVE